MKRTVIILAVLLLAGAFFIFFGAKESNHVGKGSSAPEFEVTDAANGMKLSSSDLKNKIIFVNFWASWCQPCKEEMPSIEALYREMTGKDDFRMVTILYRDSAENAFDYMRAHGYTFPVYIDAEGSAARDYGVTGVPETYIVDKRGEMAKRVIGGADWSSPDEKNLIKALF